MNGRSNPKTLRREDGTASSAPGPELLLNVRGTELLAGESRTRYRQKIARITLDSMVQFVGLLDAQGTVLEINQVALDAVGIKLSDVEGKPFWTTFWWQVSEEINATLRESIRRAAQGEFVRWDTEIYGRAGGKETIVIDASLMPVKDELGNVVFIAAEGRDITEKKAYEREIARQREELAKLDVLKTQFFANISHEFRTPLTLMLGPLEDVLANAYGVLPGGAAESLSTSHRNAMRLLKLVNTLLDFSRIEAGRIQASYQPTDLPAFTAELASNFRSLCEKAGLRLIVNCAALDEAEPAYVDRDMWEKIVLNLVSNAFKFTLEGEIEVRLEAIVGHARLTVRDTGVGIPSEELPRMFERFHRIERSQGRTHEGTGIGLALVQELTKLHGGTITVASVLGQGSTFTVTIPLGKAHLAPDRIGKAPALASTAIAHTAFVEEALRWLPDPLANHGQAPPSGNRVHSRGPHQDAGGRPAQKARIVWADDNADMRAYVSRLLGTRFDVQAVPDGAAAFEAARACPPDLILSDVMMPRLDGFGLLRALRADSRLREIPIILLSARAGEESRIEGIGAGADDYLVKPFSANELFARVDTALKLKRIREEARAQFEALLNDAPIGLCLIDADFRIRQVNPTALSAFGEIPDLIGRDFEEVLRSLWPKESAAKIARRFHHTLDTGEPYIEPELIEERLDRGVREYYDWRISRIPLPDGRFGVVCYFRDISSQVRAREGIARSEARFRGFVTATSDVVYCMSPDWGEMRRLRGRDLIADTKDPSRSWLEKYIHPEDQEHILAAIRKAIDGKTIFELEHRVIRVDGSLGWTFSRAVPLLDAQGEIVEWFGTARDVTERKRAEGAIARLTEQAERQRRLYHTILSSTPDLVYVFDLNHCFTYANDALLKMWGKTADEAIGKNCLELGYEKWHAEMHDREIEQVIASKEPVRGEVPFHGTQGRRIYDYIFVPVLGTSGEVEAIAGTTRDVTERKMAEEELRRVNQDLEQFAYTASHDLQEPLRSVKIYSELLKGRYGDKFDGQGLEFLDHVRSGATRMEMLVRDLLAYTRTNLLDKPTEPMDASEALQIALENLAGAIAESSAKVTFDPLPAVPVHATHLQQLLQNLVGNAIKYRRPEAVPAVHVTAQRRERDWLFSVSDNGIGIEMEFKERIFGLFKRLHGDEYAGTGIGLAICQRIVERYHGRIWVESEPGRGSTFYFTLPV